MSVNSSSNDSLLDPNISPISSYLPFSMRCLTSRPGSLIFTTFFITSITLLLSLSFFVLHVGFQRWRQQRSTSTAATTMSHSDIFTYHMVAMELIGVLGQTLFCCGIHKAHVIILFGGYCLWSFTWFGEMLFHLLTCVEHYLAVVHPITYLSLKRERGIKIRNITLGFVWLLSVGVTSLLTLRNVSMTTDFCVIVFSLIVISFCSLSVLRVLIRPGPGEKGGDSERVDHSKKRAFYTIVAILGVLLLRSFWSVVWGVLYVTGASHGCVPMASGYWIYLPSSLVLPLLFLIRAGTFKCCKNSTK